MRSILFS